jgi:hypothetical protein
MAATVTENKQNTWEVIFHVLTKFERTRNVNVVHVLTYIMASGHTPIV